LVFPSARSLIWNADSGCNCTPTMARRAVWDKVSQSAQLICCATVLADYAKILYYDTYKNKKPCQRQTNAKGAKYPWNPQIFERVSGVVLY